MQEIKHQQAHDPQHPLTCFSPPRLHFFLLLTLLPPPGAPAYLLRLLLLFASVLFSLFSSPFLLNRLPIILLLLLLLDFSSDQPTPRLDLLAPAHHCLLPAPPPSPPPAAPPPSTSLSPPPSTSLSTVDDWPSHQHGVYSSGDLRRRRVTHASIRTQTQKLPHRGKGPLPLSRPPSGCAWNTHKTAPHDPVLPSFLD